MFRKMRRYGQVVFRNIVRPSKMQSGPAHYQIEVTTFCNLACVMCPHPTRVKNHKHMSFEQFKLVYDTIKPLKVSMSGIGEPFLNPDMIPMVEYASANNSKTITTTNLTVIDKGKAADIVKSGLYLLKGSIDSTDPDVFESIRKKNLHHKVLEGLNNLREAKADTNSQTPIVRVQFVIQKSNYQQIPDVLELCKQLGVDAVNFQPLDLTLEGTPDKETYEALIGDLKREDLLEVIKASASKAEALSLATNLSLLFRDFDDVWKKYELKAVKDDFSHVCIMPWTSTYVTVDGDVRPCCAFPVDEDMNMGNLFSEPFKDIWNSEKYQQFRQEFKEKKRQHITCQFCIAPTVYRIVKSNILEKHMIFR